MTQQTATTRNTRLSLPSDERDGGSQGGQQTGSQPRVARGSRQRDRREREGRTARGVVHSFYAEAPVALSLQRGEERSCVMKRRRGGLSVERGHG